MAAELQAFRTADGRPYRLVPLPWPRTKLDNAGERMPATYANFLIINGAVLVPTYRDAADAVALEQLKTCFPGREIIGIDCLPLIWQHGSLHCVTMQLPAGFCNSGALRPCINNARARALHPRLSLSWQKSPKKPIPRKPPAHTAGVPHPSLASGGRIRRIPAPDAHRSLPSRPRWARTLFLGCSARLRGAEHLATALNQGGLGPVWRARASKPLPKRPTGRGIGSARRPSGQGCPVGTRPEQRREARGLSRHPGSPFFW